METGLFEIQAGELRDYRQNRRLLEDSRDVIHAVFRPPAPGSAQAPVDNLLNDIEKVSDWRMKATAAHPVGFARCFLRLANLPNFTVDRLSRYEATLWRQKPDHLHTRDT
jgi:hypothetical protein